MPNNSIPDWKKAAIVILSRKYGYRAIGKKLDIDYKTARRYHKKLQSEGELQMEGNNLELVNATA